MNEKEPELASNIFSNEIKAEKNEFISCNIAETVEEGEEFLQPQVVIKSEVDVVHETFEEIEDDEVQWMKNSDQNL